jgi:3-hydroxyisobutyrate dehydrogenase
MSTIAVLGTGLLGSGLVENALAKGHTVRVWNRTAAKAAALGAKGAVVAKDPADAVRGASHVHLALAEDDAVDSVIGALRPGLGPRVPVIDHTTNLPAKVAARVERLGREGVRYVPAPVFMSPQNAREGSGIMLISGPKAEVDDLRAHLSAMTGTLVHAGERPDLAAVWKLAGNSMFFALAAAMTDVFAIGRGSDVDAATMLKLFDTFKPGMALQGIGQRVLHAGENAPSFELTMARKDARLMAEAAGRDALLVLPPVTAAMDKAIARGDGARDYTIFTRA